MSSGVHRVALPELVAGIYIIHVTIDQFTTALRLVSTGNEILLSGDAIGASWLHGCPFGVLRERVFLSRTRATRVSRSPAHPMTSAQLRIDV